MKGTKDLKQVLMYFVDGKVDESDIDWIITEVTKVNRSEIELNKEVTKSEIKRIFRLTKKRLLGIPLCQILKKSNFYGYDFFVNKNCLMPRCETEELVALVLKTIKQGTGLDIGTGSGAISITIAKENPNINMSAVDISSKCIKIARKNAKNLEAKVNIFKSNLFSNVNGKFDFIVSNPPYIKTDELNKLQDEVKLYEPTLALNGGVDGLAYYKRIISEAPHYLKENGYIFFEVGIDEAESVKKLLEKDFKNVTIIKDLEKIDRIVYAKIK